MTSFMDASPAWTTLASLGLDMQGERLLRLHFPHNDAPAGATLLANSLDASESLSRDFCYVVEVLSDDAAVPLDSVIGKMVCIELVREDGSLRYFNGHVFEFRFLRTDGGFAFYEMVLEPWLAHLHLRQNNRAYHGLNVAALTETVLEDYLMRDYHLGASGPDPAITYICQHNESDHNLLHRHWEQLGWHYFYEHRRDGHTLRLSDDSTSGQSIDGDIDSMPFRHHAGSQEDDGVHQWSGVRRMAPAQMTVASFNFKYPRSARASRDTLNRQGSAPPLEVYENTGSYGFRHLDDGEALAQRRMEECEAKAQQFEAQGNDRTAQPGRWFTLSGHFAGTPPTRYLILSVRHFASNNYHQGRNATSHYSNSFCCIERNVPWRPGRNFHSKEPKIYGVQTAIVVGPPGEEIYTDGYGRVKVQFHWDRLGSFDDKSSPWIRVVSSWAGANFGHISLPRIGMEVVVQFLDGNVALPIITGCVYNARNMPPWELPANKTQSGMLSRSSKKGDATHANALRFEDKKDCEELWLHAEKDQRIEVEHDESHWVGHDRRKTIDRDETVHVKRHRTVTVGQDETITVHGHRKERVDQNEQIDIGGDRREHVHGNEQVQIDGFRSERVLLAKEESIGLAKALTIGAAYQTTVMGAMNTSVVMTQTEQIGMSKTVMVGADSALSATSSHTVTVGTSSITVTPGRIELQADEIIIRGRSKVQLHGDDIDNNPG